MKRVVRMMLILARLLVVVGCALVGYELTSIVLGISRIIVSPRMSQRCLWFEPDVLTLGEEFVAGLLVSLVVCVTGSVWMSILGYQISLFTLLIWVGISVIASFAVQGYRTLRQ